MVALAWMQLLVQSVQSNHVHQDSMCPLHATAQAPQTQHRVKHARLDSVLQGTLGLHVAGQV